MEYNIAGWFGGWELLIIFGAILLLFGGKKIPELMKGIGKGVREFNRTKEKVKSDFEDGMKESDEKKEKSDDINNEGKDKK